MTPEELRSWAGYQTNRRMVIEKLLEHIDSQTTEIKRLQAGAVTGNEFVDDLMANCNSIRSRAQKAEAELEQQAAYVARLEAAYLQAYAASVKLDLFDPSWKTPENKAREALERIKHGD